MENESFNDSFRRRTKAFAINIIKFIGNLKKNDELRILCKQLLRSSTSVAANFRAACRARSQAEYFAKLCIVVEEADESLFWLELLEEAELCKTRSTEEMKKECTEILSVMAVTRKNLKIKLRAT